MTPQWIAASLALLGAIAVVATRQGTPAAAGLGLAFAWLAIAGLGGWVLAPLAVFVLGGGWLTGLGRDRKAALAAAESQHRRRGVGNVTAKIAVPASLAVVSLIMDRPELSLHVAYAACLAAAAADTAATELGPLGGGEAFAFEGWRWRRCPHGTPGGVSVIGLGAGVLAAAAVAATGTWAGAPFGAKVWPGIVAIAMGSSLLESMLAQGRAGRALGHHGRNLLLTASAAALSLAWVKLLGDSIS